jgi:endonuclease YncB( thermonuclease family)
MLPRIVVAIIALVAPAAAFAGDPPCFAAVNVLDGVTLRLDRAIEGSDTVRLAGLRAPEADPQAAAGAASPWADKASDALRRLVAGNCLIIQPDAPEIDRYNQLQAHLYREDGRWLQQALLQDGLARVLPGLDAAERVRAMLPIEAAARAARAGIWADPAYAVRTPDSVGRDVGTLQLVEGRVLKATRVGPRVYLNFGEDWRRDFTIVVPAAAMPAFARAGINLTGLAGQPVRVRGLVDDFNGAMIEIDRPEFLELLAPQP